MAHSRLHPDLVREWKKLPLAELAAQLDLSQSTISRVLNGHSLPANKFITHTLLKTPHSWGTAFEAVPDDE